MVDQKIENYKLVIKKRKRRLSVAYYANMADCALGDLARNLLFASAIMLPITVTILSALEANKRIIVILSGVSTIFTAILGKYRWSERLHVARLSKINYRYLINMADRVFCKADTPDAYEAALQQLDTETTKIEFDIAQLINRADMQEMAHHGEGKTPVPASEPKSDKATSSKAD